MLMKVYYIASIGCLKQLHEHVHGGQCTEALLSCPLWQALNCRSRVRHTYIICVSTCVFITYVFVVTVSSISHQFSDITLHKSIK